MVIKNLNLNKHLKKLMIIGSFIIVGSMTGCAKKCEHSGVEHTHEYAMELEDGGYNVIRESSLENLKGWTKTDSVIFEENNFDLDESKNHKLFYIEDNLDILLKYEKENSNYYEYEYEYIDREISHYLKPSGGISYTSIATSTKYVNGKLKTVNEICSPVYKNITKTNWTRSDEGNLTGNKRLVTAKYRGVMIDQKGKELYSDWVDSITDIDENYKYFDFNNCINLEHETVLTNSISK